MAKTYTLVLNSANRITGSHNNPTFDVGWCELLPEKVNLYNVKFCFQTVGGYYRDNSSSNYIYQSALVNVNFNSRSFSFDTSTMSPSLMLGIIRRDLQNSNTIGASLNCTYDSNPPRTISKPIDTIVTFKIINQNDSSLLVNSDSFGVQTMDMTPWTAMLEFIPIMEDIKLP